jgi:cob(I)alamin adenosyltransferase
MKIYTKLGDNGETSLIGGQRVPKHHIRIKAYGTVDELIACIAMLRDSDIKDKHKVQLLEIQHVLMNCTALLAAADGADLPLPAIESCDIEKLEYAIDQMELHLPKLQSFIIPGGHMASSICHLARNVCRRAERVIIELNENSLVDDFLKKYINRLSDFLFVLSRKILYDKGIDEILWNK